MEWKMETAKRVPHRTATAKALRIGPRALYYRLFNLEYVQYDYCIGYHDRDKYQQCVIIGSNLEDYLEME